jgi:hypothetical protein
LNSATLDLVGALAAEQDEAHKPKAEFLTGNGLFVQDNETSDVLSPPSSVEKREARKVQTEEIEDEYWEMEARMPKAKRGILEEADGESAMPEEVEEESHTVDIAEGQSLPPPPLQTSPISLRPKRRPKAGDSAIGVSVLSVRGRVGSLEEGELDLRLDSCADITLMSEEYHRGMKSPLRSEKGGK